MGQREEIIARETMLKKIRDALLVQKEHPYEDEDLSMDVFTQIDEMPELVFARKFMEAGGSFVFCEDVNDFHIQFNAMIDQYNWNKFRIGSKAILDFTGLPENMIIQPESSTGEEVSITRCEYLAARTGSIVISTTVCPDRLAWSYCHSHIVIAATEQVVEGLTQAYKLIKEKYSENYPSLVSVITGPSRTADIEKQLVMGAHGPAQVFVFLIDKIS